MCPGKEYAPHSEDLMHLACFTVTRRCWIVPGQNGRVTERTIVPRAPVPYPQVRWLDLPGTHPNLRRGRPGALGREFRANGRVVGCLEDPGSKCPLFRFGEAQARKDRHRLNEQNHDRKGDCSSSERAFWYAMTVHQL